MKNLIFSLTLCAIAFVYPNCSKKECKRAPVSADVPQIQKFASDNNLTVLPHSSGLYYQILNSGNGGTVTASDSVVITYVGKFMNGQVFDHMDTPNNNPPTNGPWALSNLIEGWRIGLSLIKEGGSIRLLIPSALGYGCEDYYDIPGNSVLYFEVNLVAIE